MPSYLAVDLGAESGRVVRGDLVDGRLRISEVCRFANRPVRTADALCWDAAALRRQVLDGIGAGMRQGPRITSIGVDAWGNDFGLLDQAGHLLADPWHHRTPRTAGMPELLSQRIDADELYAITGTQFLPITTACQLLAMRGTPALAAADRLVLIPDLVTYWLTGRLVTERTVASTSQLWDIRKGRWSTEVIDHLDLPARLFDTEVVAPGTPVGPLLPAGPDAGAGVGPAPLVVAVGGHDTASAVAAVPSRSPAFGYISCGTWSLVGMEIEAPITTGPARAAHFTNEAGVGDRVRFLSNVNGLWLLQECRRAWSTGGAVPSYPQLTAAAAAAPAFRTLVDPDDPSLLGMGDMPTRLAALCRRSGEPVPPDPGATVRCILESLACRYRWALEQVEALTERRLEVVHLVGGGAANGLLCQLTADLTGRPVIAGPVEASSVGNLLVQAIVDGRLAGLDDLRALVRRSFPAVTYEPHRDREPAEAAYGRFVSLLGAGQARR
jgi:rhamnulokinase